jgi:hypothetical protein
MPTTLRYVARQDRARVAASVHHLGDNRRMLASIRFRSGESVLSPGATNTAGQQIVVNIIAAQIMKYLQRRHIAPPFLQALG